MGGLAAFVGGLENVLRARREMWTHLSLSWEALGVYKNVTKRTYTLSFLRVGLLQVS